MATVSTYRNDALPTIEQDVQHIQKVLAIPNAAANNADAIEVFKFPLSVKGRIVHAILRTSATLGAGCTLQLRVNRSGVYTVITAATTAGAASKVDGSAQAGVPFTVQGGDVIEALVGGANVGAAATVTVDFGFAPYSNSSS